MSPKLDKIINSQRQSLEIMLAFFEMHYIKKINKLNSESTSPDDLTIFKKRSINRFEKPKKNYRPISILPNVSKIFEMWKYDKLVSHF